MMAWMGAPILLVGNSLFHLDKIASPAFGNEVPRALAGNKVEKWLKTPFDLAAFGPRAGMGALLSFPDRMQTL